MGVSEQPGSGLLNHPDYDECLFDLQHLDDRLRQSSERLFVSDEKIYVQVFEPGSPCMCSSSLVEVVQY